MTRSENYLREFASVLFAQRQVIFWTTIALFLGSILVAAFWPRMYSATGSILLSGKQMDVSSSEALEKQPTPRAFEPTKEDLAAEMEILLSPDVIKNALRSLTTPPRDPEADRVVDVKNHLEVTPVPASTVITVVYYDRDPKQAVRILDALLEQYLSYRVQFYKMMPSQLSPSFLAERAEHDQKTLEQKEQELIDLVGQTGITAPQQELDSNIVLKKRLEEELNNLNGQYIEQKSVLEHMQRALENKDLQYFAFLESATIAKLGEKLTDLTAERGNRARVYLPQSEVLRTIDEQILATFESLKAEVHLVMEGQRKKLKATAEKVALIRESLADYDARNVELYKQIIETERLKREARLLQHSYETLSKRKGEVEINEQVAPKDTATMIVSILSKAFPSVGPVYPSPLTIPLGLVVGLLTGLGLGYVREYFDHTFKKPSDVTDQVGLPMLFSLTDPKSTTQRSYVYLTVLILLFVGTTLYTLVQYRIIE